jgi:hypothetical protein
MASIAMMLTGAGRDTGSGLLAVISQTPVSAMVITNEGNNTVRIGLRQFSSRRLMQPHPLCEAMFLS